MPTNVGPGVRTHIVHDRKCTLRCVRITIVAVEKQYILSIMNVCLYFALLIRHAMRISSAQRYIFLCSLSASTNFSTLSHNDIIFEKRKRLLDIKCVFAFSTQLLSKTFLILKRIHRHVIIDAHET
jgi:hypothetical protein